MSKNKRELMTRGHTVDSERNVSVANTATGDLNDDFVRGRGKSRKLNSLQRSVRSLQLEPVSSSNARHCGPLSVPALNFCSTNDTVETHRKQ